MLLIQSTAFSDGELARGIPPFRTVRERMGHPHMRVTAWLSANQLMGVPMISQDSNSH
jgi:hypothetical protein